VKVLIVGASGNLGSHLSKHLLQSPHRLNLPTHERGFPFDLPEGANAEIVQGNLNDPASLQKVCKNVDCIVYLAGVLFRHAGKAFFIARTPSLSKISSMLRYLGECASSFW
jgi:uncharacterized protein YbjT (DUF2867 family)